MNKKTVTLITRRLILKKIKNTDYREIFNTITGDYNIYRYLRSVSPHENIDIAKKKVEKWANEYKKPCTYRWLVTLRNTEIIGMIEVINKDLEFMNAEVLCLFGSDHWGYGYASEALKEVINYLHYEGFVAVYGSHVARDIGAGKAMKKAGMSCEGVLKSRFVDKYGKRDDVCVYSSIDEEAGTRGFRR